MFKSVLETLPNSPGVYQFFDAKGEIIYVGKAKNLKKRINSYFNRHHESVKLDALVTRVANIKYIVVFDESDAFLLENTLIKHHQPYYNVSLKDDKVYPSICITNERFPRVLIARQRGYDNVRYFGPYASAYDARKLVDLIRKIYKLRNCGIRFFPKSKVKMRKRPCLEYDMKNCNAPCIGNQMEEEYNEAVNSAIALLTGKCKETEEKLRDEMFKAAQKYDFEKAQELKEGIALIKMLHRKSIVVNTNMGTIDVFFLKKHNGQHFCNFSRIKNGSLFHSHTFEFFSTFENETKEDALYSVILQVKEIQKELSPTIIVPIVPRGTIDNITFIVPTGGERLKILRLAEANCNAHIAQRVEQIEKTNTKDSSESQVIEMQRDLGLRNPPNHIECFDNSNIQGTSPVASCVVFKNTKPSKKDYRSFIIKTVEGANDFASMQEVITRRYSRLSAEKKPLPQLIVVDGGKGQLSAAYEALQKLGLDDKIEIIGLAKRLEEVFFVNRSNPLRLSKDRFSLKVLMQIRDEAHRFAITFHRKRRSKQMVKHSLFSIEGLGEKSANALLQKYQSISCIQQAGYEDVCNKVGVRTANALRAANFFI